MRFLTELVKIIRQDMQRRYRANYEANMRIQEQVPKVLGTKIRRT